MEKVRNGIYATAMDNFVRNRYEEIKDIEIALTFLEDWLQIGVPDGNTLGDNIADFGSQADFEELLHEFLGLCKTYSICPNFSKEIKEIQENIKKMLDNPYYFVV